jgi:DNA topoisomerase IB
MKFLDQAKIYIGRAATNRNRWSSSAGARRQRRVSFRREKFMEFAPTGATAGGHAMKRRSRIPAGQGFSVSRAW